MESVLKFSLTVLAACSVFGLFAPFYWLFDLYNHFRPHAVVAALLLMVAALTVHRRYLLAAFGIAMLNAVLIGIALYQTQGIERLAEDVDHASTTTIVFANVLTSNRQYELATKVLSQPNADIIALAEVNTAWLDELVSIENDYPYQAPHPREDNFGLAIFSKRPFQAEYVLVGDYKRPLAIADFSDFILIVAHPVTPITKKGAEENRRYLEYIADYASHTSKPLIVTGDLNATLWGDAMRSVYRAGMKRINPLGVAYTWPSIAPFVPMQLDHFFAKSIKASDFEVLEYTGSDHFPVMATIAITNEIPQQ